MQKLICDRCEKEVDEVTRLYESDVSVCNDCFDELEARAENAYDVARDEGRI